jgi:hypothetical protein
VQRDNVTGSGWNNDRIYYYYARWNGTAWERKFIAHGGRPLYSAEDDYGGGMCIDPENPNVVYFSSNAANPFNLGNIDSVPLRTNDRYEIYRGVTSDGGQTFDWEQITVGSQADNLRPIVPENHGYDRSLVWFNGTYTSYTSFKTRVLTILKNELTIKTSAFSPQTNSATLTWKSSPGWRYNIMGSTNLTSFGEVVATGIDSQGGSTSHSFSFPAAMQGSPAGFFRIGVE